MTRSCPTKQKRESQFHLLEKFNQEVAILPAHFANRRDPGIAGTERLTIFLKKDSE